MSYIKDLLMEREEQWQINLTTMSTSAKTEQYIHVKRVLEQVLMVESFKEIEVNNVNELRDYVNQINLSKAFNWEEGYGYKCILTNCNSNKDKANYYLARDGKTYLYKCHECGQVKTNWEILYNIFTKEVNMKHGAFTYLIKNMLRAEYVSPYHTRCKEIIKHNRELINALPQDSALRRYLTRRRLIPFYNMFLSLAHTHTQQNTNEDYVLFYASSNTINNYMERVMDMTASNRTNEKVNVLALLGLINKVDAVDNPYMAEKSILYSQMQQEAKYWIKEVNVFAIKEITSEDILEAEKIASTLLDNKINRVNRKIIDEFFNKKDEVYRVKFSKKEEKKATYSKDEEKFIKHTIRVIEKEIEANGCLLFSKLASKTDPKCKYWNKAQKERYKKRLLPVILKRGNFLIEKANQENKEKYNLPRDIKHQQELIVRR